MQMKAVINNNHDNHTIKITRDYNHYLPRVSPQWNPPSNFCHFPHSSKRLKKSLPLERNVSLRTVAHFGVRVFTQISSSEYNLGTMWFFFSSMWMDVRGHTEDSKQVLLSREKSVTAVVSEDKDTIPFHEARKRFKTSQGGIFLLLLFKIFFQ